MFFVLVVATAWSVQPRSLLATRKTKPLDERDREFLFAKAEAFVSKNEKRTLINTKSAEKRIYTILTHIHQIVNKFRPFFYVIFNRKNSKRALFIGLFANNKPIGTIWRQIFDQIVLTRSGFILCLRLR